MPLEYSAVILRAECEAKFSVTITVILPSALQVTELLYTKQTQLERLAAEKAAQQLAHERQLSQVRDDAERVKRYAFITIEEQAGCMILVVNTFGQCLLGSASDMLSQPCLTKCQLSPSFANIYTQHQSM